MAKRRPVTVGSLLRAFLVVSGGGALALPLFLGILLGHRTAHPGRHRPTVELIRFGPRACLVELRSRDGLRLAGIWSPPVGSAPVLVLTHGIGACRDDWPPWSDVFSRAGYGVLVFDWRAHGDSEGDTLRFGAVETQDLLGVLDWLKASPEAGDAPVGIVAISMGAAITAQTAPDLPERVRCLVLDSPYGSLSRMIATRAAPFGVLGGAVHRVTQLYGRVWLGVDEASVVPEDRLRSFVPRPVLVMHTDNDRVIPSSEGHSVFAAYPGPKESWFSPVGEHLGAWVKLHREWGERVAGFLARTLPGAPPASEVLRWIPESGQDFREGRMQG